MRDYLLDIWSHSNSRARVVNVVVGAVAAIIAVYLVYSIFTNLFDFNFINSPYGSPDQSAIFSAFEVQGSNPRWLGMLKGAGNTLSVVVFAIAFSSILGLLVGVARLASNPILTRLGKIYVETFRNLPLLLIMVFFAFGLFRALPQIHSLAGINGFLYLSNRGIAIPWLTGGHSLWWLWLPVLAAAAGIAVWVQRRRSLQENLTGRSMRGTTWGLSIFMGLATVSYIVLGFPLRVTLPEVIQLESGFYTYSGGNLLRVGYVSGLMSLTLYFSAFIAEIVRGSIQAVPHGQVEASASLGFTVYQRFTLIILPQALRTMIPSLNNEYQNTNKDSTLAHAIGYGEIVLLSNRIVNNAGNLLQVYLFIFIVFIVTNLIISMIMNTINRNVQMK